MHTEEYNAKRRRYYSEHREEMIERSRTYRKNHPEVVKKTLKRRYENHKEELKERSRLYRKNHPNYSKGYNLKYFFGITLDDFNTMLQKQDHRCKICGVGLIVKGPRVIQPSVDHDHLSGKVRGLLCANCNHLLGQAKDSTEILQNAINYLKENKYE